MSAVWYRARTELRAHRRGAALITLLVAVASGTVLTAVAGAHRTTTSLDRYLAASQPAHVQLSVPEGNQALLEEIAALPEAESSARFATLAALPEGVEYVPTAANLDGHYGRDLDRPPIIDGRLPDEEVADEIALGENFARSLDLSVGGIMTVVSYTPAQVSGQTDEDEGPGEPLGPTVELTVVGVARVPEDLSTTDENTSPLVFTRAFHDRYRDEIGTFGVDAMRVRLRGGEDAVPGFIAAVDQLAGADVEVDFEPVSYQSAGVRDSLDALGAALLLFAAVAGLAALVVLVQAVARQAWAAARDEPVLAALGMRGRHRVMVLASPQLLAGLAGVLIGTVLAVAASALMPIGVGRRAEPDPGLSFDGAVLVPGAVAAVAVVVTVVILVTRRAARQASAAGSPVKPSSLVGRLAGAGAPPTVVTGLRLALERGGGRDPVPVRAGLLGVAVGAGAAVATVVFAASLERLVTTPERYGWNWDASVAGPQIETSDLAGNPDVGELGVARSTNIEVDGNPVDALGFRSLEGSLFVTVVEGEPADQPGEVVLGSETMAQADASIGDTVRLAGPAGAHDFRVVGQAPFPPIDDNPVLAEGAALSEDDLERLVVNDDQGEGGFETIILRWASGVDGDAVGTQLQEGLADTEVKATPSLPPEIERLRQVDRLPWVLTGFLSLLATLALTHTLVTGVRRRKAFLATLKVLGFTRRQVSGTVAWQATFLTLVGLAVAAPFGVIVGRQAWRLVAEGLGVASDARVPTNPLLLAGVAALLVAAVVAVTPARRAGRLHPGAALSTE